MCVYEWHDFLWGKKEEEKRTKKEKKRRKKEKEKKKRSKEVFKSL